MKNEKSQPIISAVVAMAKNRVIGKNNQLPWHLPADLKHFKALTIGHTVIMGRKTYESIGKPLPKRHNVIISRNLNLAIPGCTVVHSISDAIKQAPTQLIFVIGGAEIYRQSLVYLNRIYLTLLHQEVEGDAFFPELDANQWNEVWGEFYSADKQQPYAYQFLQFERI